jgi:hypothetical protein
MMEIQADASVVIRPSRRLGFGSAIISPMIPLDLPPHFNSGADSQQRIRRQGIEDQRHGQNAPG